MFQGSDRLGNLREFFQSYSLTKIASSLSDSNFEFDENCFELEQL